MSKYESHFWNREDILFMRKVTLLWHKMHFRMVSDGNIVDEESGEVFNIVSKFYEVEKEAGDLDGTIGDDERISVSADVTDGEVKIVEEHLLEMEQIEGMFANEVERYKARDELVYWVQIYME